MGCYAPFDLEQIETLAVNTDAGVFDLSPMAWVVLQAAMGLIANHWNWCGEWGNGEALTDSERDTIDEIVREVQQAINEEMTDLTVNMLTVNGVSVPAVDMNIDSLELALRMTAYSNTAAHSPTLKMRRTRGVQAAQTAILLNDFIGEIHGGGHNGTAIVDRRVSILLRASENWAVGANGTEISFFTNPNGASGQVRRATIHNDGRFELENTLDHDGTLIGLNGSTPVAKGTITGSRGGNAALANLLTYLASRGDIVDNTTA